MSNSSSSSSSSLVESSSSVVLSSSSISESMSTIETTESAPEASIFYIVLIPKHGDHEVLAYKNTRQMVKALTKWLEKKQSKHYEGEILLFKGQILEYSEPIMNYRLNIPGTGELAVSGGTKDKYVRPVPKKD